MICWLINYHLLPPPPPLLRLLEYPPPPPELRLLEYPPRLPPPPVLSSLSFATETDIARPSTSLLLRPNIASFPSSSEAISTKPKPRERPLSLSIITLAELTVPNCAKSSFNSTSLVLKLKFET